MRPARRAALAATAALLLAACAQTPVTPPDIPAPPAAFLRADAPTPAPSADTPSAAWWTALADPALDALIADAPHHHPVLQQAEARLAAATAARRAAAAAGRPMLGLGVSAGTQGGPLVNAAGDSGALLDARLALRHEIDPAGRRAGAEQAAAQDEAARAADLAQARLDMQAAIATQHLAWRAAVAQAALRRESADAARARLTLAEGRQRLGLADDTELAPLRRQAGDADAAALQATRQADLAWHALAQAAGRAPADLPPIPATPLPPVPTVAAGLPAQVLARRPDLAASQQALWAAQTRLGLARDADWPRLQLTASGGLVAPALSQWLRASAASFTLGLLLDLPLFDGGRRDAERDAAAARLALAGAEHRGRIVQALREVEDQLLNGQALAREAALRDGAVAGAQAALARQQAQAARGLVPQDAVLRATQALLDARLAAQQVHTERWQASVALVRALGGGAADAGSDSPVATAAAADLRVAVHR